MKTQKKNGFIIVILCILSAAGFAEEIQSVRIVDELGTNVSSFQCVTRWKILSDRDRIWGSLTWKDVKSGNGFVRIDVDKLKESSKDKSTGQIRANGLEIFLMADGYAPEFLRYEFEHIPAEIKLGKPVRVILEKKNQTVAGDPVIVPAECIDELLHSFSKYPLRLKKVGSDKWQCDLKKGQGYVIGWKAKKGWFSKEFHGYCSEPFIAEENGQTVSFEPGLPVTFEYDLSNAPEFLNIEKYPVNVRLEKAGPDGARLHFSFHGEGTVEMQQPDIAQIPNLAAGTYYLTAQSNPKGFAIPQISDKRQITIKPGKECRIEPIYPVLDTTVEQGDVSIKGIVLDADQRPIANKQVTLWMQRVDENKTLIESDIFYEPVKTNAMGEFYFEGILPGRNIRLNLQNYPREAIFLARGSCTENAEINVSVVVGQKGKAVTVGKPFAFPIARLENNKKKYLNDFKGKIIVIDIWASWCSPCIDSMPKLNKLAKQMRSEDIKFITLSIDRDQQAWKNKLTENNWQFLLHTWFDDTINNHKLKSSGGIPFYVIIDRQGIVRAAGNEVDIKNEIERIRKKVQL